MNKSLKQKLDQKKKYSRQKFQTPAPTIEGSVCLLGSVAVAFLLYPGEASNGVVAMASTVSKFVLIGFLGSLFFDLKLGVRNLFRTDILCLFAMYGLTLLEFLFPQPNFESMTNPVEIVGAINVVLVGFASFVIGRHLTSSQPMTSKWLTLNDISDDFLFGIVVFCGFFGYLYIFLAVNFNFVEMIDAMMGARFTQPWGRGRLGGWKSLLNELGLFAYIIPPLTAVAWNRLKTINIVKLGIITAIFLLVIFHSFSTGSRNIFIAHLSTFLVAYILTVPKNTIVNTILPFALVFAIAGYGSYHMLEFRTIGLKSYVQNKVYASESTRDTFHADYNLSSMAWVIDAMPERHPFLGIEVITWSLIKPIPRAMMPGKPPGLSVSIEEVIGAEGYTVAVTYLGEAYMGFGMLGVIGMSLFFGWLSSWWNRMVSIVQSDYGLVVYALGFFAAGITMRSFFWLTTALLPVIALIIFRRYSPSK